MILLCWFWNFLKCVAGAWLHCRFSVRSDSDVPLLWLLLKSRYVRILDTIVYSEHCFGCSLLPKWKLASGLRFTAALLPRLLGTNLRSHHKGATGRVGTGDQQLPVLCHCQLGKDIPHCQHKCELTSWQAATLVPTLKLNPAILRTCEKASWCSHQLSFQPTQNACMKRNWNTHCAVASVNVLFTFCWKWIQEISTLIHTSKLTFCSSCRASSIEIAFHPKPKWISWSIKCNKYF